MNDTQVQLSREFNAPVQEVWDAWTKPEQIAQWWGPEGSSVRIEELNFKPQGTWRYVMVDEQTGGEYAAEGIFAEVVEGRKIVTTDKFGDADLDTASKLPKGIVVTVTFEPTSTGTKLTLTIDHPSVESKVKHEAMGVLDGWESSFTCLESFLANNK